MSHLPGKVFSLILVLFLHLPLAHSRTIALVYDDSGSMANHARWCYANYALQALVGLMTDKDTLFVTRMSRPTRADKVSSYNIYRYISKLHREHHPSDQTPTPYEAIETAMKAIRSVGGTDNWLLVITDGNFSHRPSDDVIRGDIIDFLEKTGTRTIFLLIGENDTEVNNLATQPGVSLWQLFGQAVVFKSLGRDQIIEKMRHICAMVTSRTGARKGPKIVSWNNKSVTIFTPFPLYRLTVLEQDTSKNALASVKTANTAKLRLYPGNPINISTPKKAPRGTVLYGKIIHITCPENDRIIPAGNIIIDFDKPVAPDKVRFLPQVAAKLEVYVRREKDGKLYPAGGTYTVCKGRELEIIARLKAENGDNLLASIKKHPDVLKSINVFCVLGNQRLRLTLDSSGDSFATKFPVGSNYAKASVVAKFPGYFYYKSNIFTVKGLECGEMKVRVMQEGTEIEPYGGVYPVCSDKKTKLEVIIVASDGSNLLQSLSEHAAINNNSIVLERNGHVKSNFSYDFKKGLVFTEINVRPEKEKFTLAAKITNYKIPSKDVTLDGTFCAHLNVAFKRADGKIVKPPTGSYRFCLGVRTKVEARLLTTDNKNFLEKLAQLGIKPSMVNISVENNKTGISAPLALRAGTSVFSGPLPLKEGEQQIQVKATIASLPPVDPVSILVNGVTCKIGILPIKPWSSKVSKLKSAPSIDVVPTFGGMPVSPEYFLSWSLKASSESRIKLKVGKNGGKWSLKVLPYYLTGITSTGKIPVVLTVYSPQGIARKRILLAIENVSWWEKWKVFIISLSVFLVLCWWIVGIVKKPRFTKSSYVEYEKSGRRGKRKNTYILASSPLNRWFVPYVPEKRTIEGITFVASNNRNHILLSRKSQKENMSINGIDPIDPPGERDVIIGVNDTLQITEARGDTLVQLTYKN